MLTANADGLLFTIQVKVEGHAGPSYQYWPESGWIPYAVLKNTLHLSNLSDCSPPQLMTAEQVKAMTVADHQNDWRMLVFRLSILIPETQGRLDSAAGRRLKVGTYTSLLILDQYNIQDVCSVHSPLCGAWLSCHHLLCCASAVTTAFPTPVIYTQSSLHC